MPERCAVGDRLAGPFHEVDAGDPAGDRQPVGFRHLAVGQDLDHHTLFGPHIAPPRTDFNSVKPAPLRQIKK
jgi:hypothetical protein